MFGTDLIRELTEFTDKEVTNMECRLGFISFRRNPRDGADTFSISHCKAHCFLLCFDSVSLSVVYMCTCVVFAVCKMTNCMLKVT